MGKPVVPQAQPPRDPKLLVLTTGPFPDGPRRRCERAGRTRQYLAFPGIRGNGIASRTLARPVTYARVLPAKTGARPKQAWHRAVAAQIAVPGVVLPVDVALGRAAVRHLQPFLALAAADDLARHLLTDTV
jgi:hypothetical protein